MGVDWPRREGVISMHMLLYMLGVSTAITGAVMGTLDGSVGVIATGLLSAVLFGALGKIIHLLELAESHLKAARSRTGWSKAQIVLSADDLIGHGLDSDEDEITDPRLN